ncbi:MAG: tRNA dihydrouridine synthase DusB [Clostridia bacterium]|nr:tRNA dihydrouridine synthase DusB [Clostridia bacterium]
MSLRIAGESLEYGLMLAPMAGFSDRAMRVVCHEAGAELSVTEMVSAKATVYGDKKTALLSRIYPDEGRVALQIFGSEPEVMARAAEILSQPMGEGAGRPFMIDINMGCPVKKIFSNGEGSALMKDPELIYRITAAVVGATPLPVSVKLRAGVDKRHINATECALAAESAGASMITIHGRTREDMYSGTVDREIIKDVKSCLHIPVIANGDIASGADALEMLSYTGADGIAIGRGAVGNPFIFSEVRAALMGESYTAPTLEERIVCALRQLKLASLDKGEAIAVPEARKQIASYLKGFRGAAELRARINLMRSYSEVEAILMEALSADDE